MPDGKNDRKTDPDPPGPRWVCQSCGYIDRVLPLPKDRAAYYQNPKAELCPKCKSEDMVPDGF